MISVGGEGAGAGRAGVPAPGPAAPHARANAWRWVSGWGWNGGAEPLSHHGASRAMPSQAKPSHAPTPPSAASKGRGRSLPAARLKATAAARRPLSVCSGSSRAQQPQSAPPRPLRRGLYLYQHHGGVRLCPPSSSSSSAPSTRPR